jgi:hypothetical protein
MENSGCNTLVVKNDWLKFSNLLLSIFLMHLTDDFSIQSSGYQKTSGGNLVPIGLISACDHPTGTANHTVVHKERMQLQPNVKSLYGIIGRATGSIGGNADGGAIYGELTASSMQRIINILKAHTGFNADSRFIDIGSGLGKPNLHVAQDPGVRFSVGIEIKRIRWMLSLHNFSRVLKFSLTQLQSNESDYGILIGYSCFFMYGDIASASTLDPFTHVYMFDIGFPPILMQQLSDIFNRSCSSYLICYHPPSTIIDLYGFNVHLLYKQNTNMHGSGEGHTGYIYTRTQVIQGDMSDVTCDPMFLESWNHVNSGINHLHDVVCKTLQLELNIPRQTRR